MAISSLATDSQAHSEVGRAGGERPRDLRRAARALADAADADRYALDFGGMGFADGEDEDLVPQAYLEALNGGVPALYELTIGVRSDDGGLGWVKLSTLRPSGFSHEDIQQALTVGPGDGYSVVMAEL